MRITLPRAPWEPEPSEPPAPKYGRTVEEDRILRLWLGGSAPSEVARKLRLDRRDVNNAVRAARDRGLRPGCRQ